MEECQLRLESESESIRILTVHKSKGLEYPVVFLPEHSFLPSQKGDSISYHKEDGKLVVDLKKSSDEEAKALAQLEEEQEDARVLYVALTRSSSRCYAYHAPVGFSKKSKLPAQVRMMRSWGLKTDAHRSDDLDAQNENTMLGLASQWLEGLTGQADHQMFSADQEEFDGGQDSAVDDSSEMVLRAKSWDPSRKILREESLTHLAGCPDKSVSMVVILMVYPKKKSSRKISWVKKRHRSLSFPQARMQEVLCTMFSNISILLIP